MTLTIQKSGTTATVAGVEMSGWGDSSDTNWPDPAASSGPGNLYRAADSHTDNGTSIVDVFNMAARAGGTSAVLRLRFSDGSTQFLNLTDPAVSINSSDSNFVINGGGSPGVIGGFIYRGSEGRNSGLVPPEILYKQGDTTCYLVANETLAQPWLGVGGGQTNSLTFVNSNLKFVPTGSTFAASTFVLLLTVIQSTDTTAGAPYFMPAGTFKISGIPAQHIAGSIQWLPNGAATPITFLPYQMRLLTGSTETVTLFQKSDNGTFTCN